MTVVPAPNEEYSGTFRKHKNKHVGLVLSLQPTKAKQTKTKQTTTKHGMSQKGTRKRELELVEDLVNAVRDEAHVAKQVKQVEESLQVAKQRHMEACNLVDQLKHALSAS